MKDRYFLVVLFAVVCTVWSEVESQDCDLEELERCLNRIEAIANNWEFGSLMSEKELHRLCRNVNRQIRCIDSYERRCIAEEQPNDFNSLLPAEIIPLKVLCYSNSSQKKLLTHGPCLRQVMDEDEQCYQTLQHSLEKAAKKKEHMKPDDEMSLQYTIALRTSCCATPDYVACLKKVATEKCGEDALKFLEDYSTELAFFSLEGKCEKIQCSSDFEKNIAYALATDIRFGLGGLLSKDDSEYCYKTEEIIKSLSPMKVVIDNGGLAMALSEEDLVELCWDASRGWHYIDRYPEQCVMEERRNDFIRGYQGPREVFKKLCRLGPYREEFLSHRKCIRQSNFDYDNPPALTRLWHMAKIMPHEQFKWVSKYDYDEHCFLKFMQVKEEFDANLLERDLEPSNELSPRSFIKLRTFCCLFREFLACMNRAITENCGEQTAKFYADLFELVNFNLIKEYCEKFDQCPGSSASHHTPPFP